MRQENGLVATFLVLPDADDFTAKIAWFDYRLLGLIPEVGDGKWGVFVHDWREIPLPTHLDRIMPQLGATGPGIEPVRDPAGLMTREQHFEAVKQLLRDCHDDEAVAANPLVRTYGEVGAMREAVIDAVESLADDPRRVNHHRAMRATYLQRATTQEAAAARLGMPFGTYRRHLRSGVDQVCATLLGRHEGAQPGRP